MQWSRLLPAFSLFAGCGYDRSVRCDFNRNNVGISRRVAVPVTGRGEGDGRDARAFSLESGGKYACSLAIHCGVFGKREFSVDGVVDDGIISEFVFPFTAGALVCAEFYCQLRAFPGQFAIAIQIICRNASSAAGSQKQAEKDQSEDNSCFCVFDTRL